MGTFGPVMLPNTRDRTVRLRRLTILEMTPSCIPVGPLFFQGCIITKSGATDRPPVTDRKRATVVGTGCG